MAAARPSRMPSPYASTSSSEGAVFFGEFHFGLDEKNRVSLPAPWRKTTRDASPSAWILVPSPNAACLLGFPPPEFEAELSRIISLQDTGILPISPADIQAFSRLFNARARQCIPDSQGRLLIPAELLATVGIGREAVLVGNRRRIEFWPPHEWMRRAAADEAVFTRVASLAGL